MASPRRAHAIDVRYAPPEPLARTLTAAEAALEFLALVPQARLDHLEAVERAAAAHVAARHIARAQLLEAPSRWDVAARHEWSEQRLALWKAEDRAFDAMAAAVATRPAGEGPGT